MEEDKEDENKEYENKEKENKEYENKEYENCEEYYKKPYPVYLLMIITVISLVILTFTPTVKELYNNFITRQQALLAFIFQIIWGLLWGIVIFMVWRVSDKKAWIFTIFPIIVIILLDIYLLFL